MSLENPAFIVKGDDGEEYGPVELAELREWVRENRAGLGTVVRMDEPESLWQPWQYYPELVALLAEARGTAPLSSPSGLVTASMGRRVLAFAIDLLLAYFLVYIILVVIVLVDLPDFVVQSMAFFQAMSSSQPTPPEPQLPPLYDILFRLITFGGIALYMAGFHFAHGRTPGKSILRLRVVNESGEKPSATQSLVRGLLLSFSVFLFFFPLIYVFLQAERRALHDLVAGTYVVEA